MFLQGSHPWCCSLQWKGLYISRSKLCQYKIINSLHSVLLIQNQSVFLIIMCICEQENTPKLKESVLYQGQALVK